ncbi:MAG: hypothetical protein ACKO0M_17480 [Cyanobium sp.]
MLTVSCALLGLQQPGWSIPNGQISAPLPTRVEQFDPDAQVCRPEAIRSGFFRQLLPWADQPAPVLARLRDVQLEMTRATLQRCVSRGLMTAAQARQLEQELAAQPPGATP